MDILTKLTTLENEATNFGFKWETSNQIMSQIKSELLEIENHLKDGDRKKLQEEIGDLLHAVFSLCVFNQFDPETTITNSVDKFEHRFKIVQRLAIKDGLMTLNGKSFDDLMTYWDKAKQINAWPP